MRTARAVPTPWLCRNTMISRITFLLGPGIDDALHPDLADPTHLAQALRRAFDDVEHRLAEPAHQLLGIDRADAADHAGAEIALDPLGRGRRRGLQEPRLELLAVGAVVDPFASGGG